MTIDTAPTVRRNECGWKEHDEDLKFVQLDAVDKEPSNACPNCRTDHYLMNAPWDHEIMGS